MPDWNVIVSEHLPEVWDTACRLAPAEAASCAKQAFLAAHEDAHRDSIADWRMLLQRHTIARCIAAHRIVSPQQSEASPLRPADLLRDGLGAFSEQLGIMFSLRYLRQCSFQEIAMELRAPLDSVGSTINAISSNLGRRLLKQSPELADESLPPAEQADDLLESAVAELRGQPVPPLPEELSHQIIESLATAPEVSFEKPPESSALIPLLAAGLILCLIGGIVWWYIGSRPKPPAILFPQVQQAMAGVKSADYRMVKILSLQDNRTRRIEAHLMLADAGHLRQMMDSPDTIVIWDASQQKALTLDEMKKRATLRNSADMFAETRPIDIRDLIASMPAEAALPAQQITMQGKPTQSFKATTADMQLQIWADVATKLPMLVELTTPQSSPPATAILSDFTWNQPVVEAQFSLEAPAGYELSAITMNLNAATEQDLIKALGVAARFAGGKYPAQFDRAGMSQLIAERQRQLPTNKLSPEYRPAVEEFEADLLQLGRGWLFISDPDLGDDWQYAGAGIFFGAEQPVIWYRPAGSRQYRVIDGQLNPKTMELDRLPTIPSTALGQPTKQPAAIPQPR